MNCLLPTYLRWVSLALLLFSMVVVKAQQPAFRQFDVDDGLAASHVFYAFQDSKGFMWFATEAGVSLFDGKQFKTITRADGTGGNESLTIHEDFAGRIWFMTYAGIPVYYHNKVTYNPVNDSLLAGIRFRSFLHSFTEDYERSVYIGSVHNGILKIKANGQQEMMRVFDGNVVGKTHYMWKDTNGHAWGILALITGPEIHLNAYYCNFNENKYYQSQYSNYASQAHAYCSKFGPNSIIRLADQGIVIFDGEEEQLIYTFEDDYELYGKNFIYAGKDSQVYVGTERGVLHLAPGKNGYYEKDRYLIDKNVSSVLQDREGNFWVTTSGDGVFFTPSLKVLTYTQADGLANSKVYDVFEDSTGKVWMAMDQGYYGTLYEHKVTNHLQLIKGKAPDRVKRIKALKNGSIWLLSNRGTTIYDQKGKYQIALPIRSVEYDEGNKVWFGTYHKLLNLPIDELEDFYYHLHEDDDFDYWNIDRPNAIKKLKDGSAVIGGINGVYHLKNDSVRPLVADNAALSTRVMDIGIDAKGSIWVATYGMGLVCVRNGTVITIQEAQGLSSNICKALHIDTMGRVWVATNNGLHVVEIMPNMSIKVKTISALDGLASNEVNSVHIRQDRVWVATSKGLTLLREAEIEYNKNPPPVYITGVIAAEKDLPIKPIYDLGFDQNKLQLSFIGLSYYSGDYIRYRYRFDGLDSAWQYTQYPQVEYPSLPDGSYSFTVQAANKDNVWSEVPATIRFNIAPPLWKTWWFILLSAFLMFDLALISLLLIIRRVRKEEQRKAAIARMLAESELKALRAQMNPHFISNSLNSIQRFIIRNNMDDAYDYLQKFGSLMRNILENSKEQVIPLDNELQTLKLYLELESLRFDKKFEYRINTDLDLDDHAISLPPMLLQPYIENAIWHGIMPKEEGGTVNIDIKRKDNYLICIIEDDGIGRERSQINKSKHKPNRTSMAMQVTLDRLKILNANKNSNLNVDITDLKTSDGEAAGTRVQLYIPL